MFYRIGTTQTESTDIINAELGETMSNKQPTPSTVGRGLTIDVSEEPCVNTFEYEGTKLFCDDSLNRYDEWEPPTVIVSDGAYGILGFQGDTPNHHSIVDWYEPHIAKWSEKLYLPRRFGFGIRKLDGLVCIPYWKSMGGNTLMQISGIKEKLT